MNKIKLVIWDLDDTFWQGTLSEGEIRPIQRNIEAIKILSERGIINSISSKNDYEKAKQILTELNIWDYFIFPSIEWNPKGLNIKYIIEKCQLRAPNVLFIDDNPINLREVKHFNPEINVLNASEIETLLYLPEVQGKNDKELSRLKQYKILEEKDKHKQSFSDNRDFLLQSEIKLSFVDASEQYIDRIVELVERTNQLNFTKLRQSSTQLQDILDNPQYECKIISVKDKYGDYGICGFYALNKEENSLLHFVFSCRAMNLGVEQYVYKKLKYPQINIVPEVSSNLYQYETIDWIYIEDSSDIQPDTYKRNQLAHKKKILFLGGCDLEQICHYLDEDKFEILTDFNYPSEKFFPIHREHTIYLREFESLSDEAKKELYNLPFADKNFFNMNFFNMGFDILVFSNLMNFTHEIYRHKKLGFKIAYGGYLDKEGLMDYLKLNDSSRRSFEEQYEYIGLQTPEDFKRDLDWLVKKVNKPIYFLNGAEIEGVNSNEPLAYERHKIMNKALDEFVAEHSQQCKIIDVRNIVKDKNDFRDTIRHYQRTVYMTMAESLMSDICNATISVSLRKRIIVEMKSLMKRINNKIRLFLKKFTGH